MLSAHATSTGLPLIKPCLTVDCDRQLTACIFLLFIQLSPISLHLIRPPATLSVLTHPVSHSQRVLDGTCSVLRRIVATVKGSTTLATVAVFVVFVCAGIGWRLSTFKLRDVIRFCPAVVHDQSGGPCSIRIRLCPTSGAYHPPHAPDCCACFHLPNAPHHPTTPTWPALSVLIHSPCFVLSSITF